MCHGGVGLALFCVCHNTDAVCLSVSMPHFLLVPQVRGEVPFNLAYGVLDQRAGNSKSLFLVILSSFPLIVFFVISNT